MMRHDPRAWRSDLLDSLGTLVLSVILAITVWLVAIDQENPLIRSDFSQPIPVTVRGLAENLQLLQDLGQKTVVLNVRAPKRSWENLKASDFTAYIDLSNLSAGTHEVAVRVNVVDPDVEVVDSQPRQLRVQIEPITSKQVPVQIEIMDDPAFGYDWQTPIVEPTQVTVIGAAILVDQVTVAVADVFLHNAKNQVERIEALRLRNAQNQEVDRVTVTPGTVRVVVPIVQRPGRKEVAVLVNLQGQPAPSYRISNVKVEPPTVILLGSPEALRNVPGFVETTPLSIESVTGEIRERLALVLPENVSTLESEGVYVTVSITPIESSATVERQPTIQGLGDNLRAAVSPNTVNVIVSGSLSRLESLGPDDVRVTLELSGLLPGSHVLQPRVVAPDGIRVEGVLPQAIEVVIEAIAPPAGTPEPTSAATPGMSASGEEVSGSTTPEPPLNGNNSTIPLPVVTPTPSPGKP